MQASQVNRARVAARAGKRARVNPGSGLVLGASTPAKPYGYTGTRRHGNKTRYAGSGERGYGSAWAASPTFWTDPKWSRTLSDPA